MMYQEENIEPSFSNSLKKNPFKTPDHYFESMEDRVMQQIAASKESKHTLATRPQRHLLKPLLAMAACLAIAVLLVFHPNSYFSRKDKAKAGSVVVDYYVGTDPYALTFSLVDENSLINTILNDDASVAEPINSDEVLAYLSSDMSDIELYSQIIK